MAPPPKEAVHRPRPEPVANLLQGFGVVARAEPIVERLEADPALVALAFGPLVTVEVDPNRPRRVSVGLNERRTPLRIPDVEIEVVHERHLPAPLHVRVPRLLLALGRPRPPHRC